MLATMVTDNLDPLHRTQICGYHCGSVTLASYHADKQIEPTPDTQGGRHRTDTAMQVCVFRSKSARHSDLMSATDSDVKSAIPI
jgi:hypothetical protein